MAAVPYPPRMRTVLVVFAPSGLGVREASVYGLVLAVASEPVALGAIILNRLAITIVELVLLLVGAVLWRVGPRSRAEYRPAEESRRTAPEAVLRSPP